MTWLPTRTVLGLASALSLLATTASASTIGFATATDSNLYSIDFGTGTSTLIGPQGVFLEALALSPSGQLFGTDTGGNLYSLNTTTGAGTLIGGTSLGNIEGLDFNGSTLVGANFNNPTTLYQINTSTAVASSLSTATSGVLRTLTIQDSNTALALSDSPSFQTLISINITTGAHTNLGTVTTAQGLFGIDFASDGTLYGVGATGGLYTLNPTTGALTLIGDTGNQFWLGLALQPTQLEAVPEPASLLLFGTGLAGLALRRYRRTRP